MLEGIRKDIAELIALYEKEKAGREALQVELTRSKTEQEAFKTKVLELDRQIDNMKLAEAFTSPQGASAEAKARLDKLIREIDRCIGLLEK